jgi:hypothetical protein
VIKYDQARTTAGKLALVLWIRVHGQTGTRQVGDESFLDRWTDTSQEPKTDAGWQRSSPRPAEILWFATKACGLPIPFG